MACAVLLVPCPAVHKIIAYDIYTFGQLDGERSAASADQDTVHMYKARQATRSRVQLPSWNWYSVHAPCIIAYTQEAGQYFNEVLVH